MTQPIHPMLERVARALCVADWDQGDDNWRAYLPDARAAVQALMEPDDGISGMPVAIGDEYTVGAHRYRVGSLPLVEDQR